MAASQDLSEGEVVCPNCKAINKADAKFCVSCGTKLGKECPNCHASVGLETKFCPNCGTDLNPKPKEVTCPDCQKVVPADAKFCPNCGHAFN